MRSLYEMYKMALPLAAALSQVNPVNTSSPISLRSVVMLLYHKFQGHPMSTVPRDFRKKKVRICCFNPCVLHVPLLLPFRILSL
jgi:hypothetical protein